MAVKNSTLELSKPEVHADEWALLASGGAVVASGGALLASDEQALKDIYFEGGGPRWEDPEMKRTWLVPGVPPCSWEGVRCSNASMDGTLRVASVALSNLGIVNISRSVGQLTGLVSLDLANNWIVELPEEIGNLSQLEQIGLNLNSLVTLPRSITKLKKLTYLSVENNELTALPEDISALVSLEYVVAGGNKLLSLPSSISQMVQLRNLEISNNPISVLPDLSAMVSLQTILIGGLEITELPIFPPNVRLLDINANKFKGTVPLCSPTVTRLNFNKNPDLTGIGPLPDNGSPCLPMLTTLDAGGCDLRSVSFLNGSSSLFDIELSDNKHLGNEPVLHAKAGSWPMLTSLRLQAIGINMTIASVMASVVRPSLISLDISRNPMVRGKIAPSAFIQSKVPNPVRLIILRLDNTSVSHLLSSMENLFPRLRTLSLRNTPIAAEVPWDQQSWQDLESLDVRGSNNPESVISRPEVYDPASTSVDIGSFSTCPSTLQGGTSSTYTILADAAAFNYSGCRCLDSHFGEPWRGCQLCPAPLPTYNVDVECVGTGNVMSVTAGWLFFDVRDRKAGEGKIAVKACPSDSLVSPCLSSVFSLTIKNAEDWRQRVTLAKPRLNITTCAPGYQGRMCSKCTTGYFRSGRSCIRCGRRLLSMLNPVLSAAMLTVLGLTTLSLGPKSRSGLVRTLTTHAQLVSTFPSLNLKISDVLSLLIRSGAGASGLRLNGLECEGHAGWDGFYGPFTLACLFPLQVVAGSAWVAFLGKLFLRRRRSTTFAAMFKTAFLYLWFAMLFTASERLFAVLNCSRYGSTSRSKYIASALWMRCRGPTYTAVAAAAGILGSLYLFGTLIFMSWKLYRHRNGFPSEVSEFFAAPFKPETHYYWELSFFFRRMALVLISALSPLSAGPAIVFMVSVVLLVSLVTHTTRHPFHRKSDNTVETVSLLLLLSCYAVGLVNSSRSFTRETLTGLGLVVLNGGFLFSLTIMVIYRVWRIKSLGRGSEVDIFDTRDVEQRQVPLLQLAQ